MSVAWTLTGPVAFCYSTVIACYGSILIAWGPGGNSCYGMILTMGTAGGAPNLCLGWHDYCLRGTEQDSCVEETKAVGPKELWDGQGSWAGKVMNCVIAPFLILSPAYFP